MANIGNWAYENSNTVGTGNVTLTGQVESFARFRDVLPTGDVYYSIDDSGNREAGIGHFNGVSVLTRTNVIETLVNGVVNSVDPTAISLSGSAVVGCALTATAYNDLLDAISTVDDASLPKDGSEPMTGPLVVGNGVDSVYIDVIARAADTNSVIRLLRNNMTVGTDIRHIGGNNDLNIRQFSTDGTTPITSFSIDMGNIKLEGEAGALTTPTDDGHLTNKAYIDGNFVQLDGSEPMTGNLTIENGQDPTVNLTMGMPGGQPSYVIRDENSTRRVDFIYRDASGSAAINVYSDTGTLLTGFSVDVDGNVLVNGSMPNEPYHLTRKDYVDTTRMAASATLTDNLNAARDALQATIDAIPQGGVTQDIDVKLHPNGSATLHIEDGLIKSIT